MTPKVKGDGTGTGKMKRNGDESAHSERRETGSHDLERYISRLSHLAAWRAVALIRGITSCAEMPDGDRLL